MYGLLQSLQAQGKTDDAARVREQFETVWQLADVTLDASRI
jgi:hypothetical protein